MPYHRGTIEVICTICRFSQVIHRGDDKLPSDIVVQHGRETGHKLRVIRKDDDVHDRSKPA